MSMVSNNEAERLYGAYQVARSMNSIEWLIPYATCNLNAIPMIQEQIDKICLFGQGVFTHKDRQKLLDSKNTPTEWGKWLGRNDDWCMELREIAANTHPTHELFSGNWFSECEEDFKQRVAGFLFDINDRQKRDSVTTHIMTIGKLIDRVFHPVPAYDFMTYTGPPVPAPELTNFDLANLPKPADTAASALPPREPPLLASILKDYWVKPASDPKWDLIVQLCTELDLKVTSSELQGCMPKSMEDEHQVGQALDKLDNLMKSKIHRRFSPTPSPVSPPAAVTATGGTDQPSPPTDEQPHASLVRKRPLCNLVTELRAYIAIYLRLEDREMARSSGLALKKRNAEDEMAAKETAIEKLNELEKRGFPQDLAVRILLILNNRVEGVSLDIDLASHGTQNLNFVWEDVEEWRKRVALYDNEAQFPYWKLPLEDIEPLKDPNEAQSPMISSSFGRTAAQVKTIEQESPVTNTEKPGAAGPEGAKHNADFTMVNWFGTEYTFSPGLQAGAVKALWAEYEKTGLGLHQEAIRETIDAERDNFRLAHVFRGHPAYGVMIKSCGGGKYRLDNGNIKPKGGAIARAAKKIKMVTPAKPSAVPVYSERESRRLRAKQKIDDEYAAEHPDD